LYREHDLKEPHLRRLDAQPKIDKNNCLGAVLTIKKHGMGNSTIVTISCFDKSM